MPATDHVYEQRQRFWSSVRIRLMLWYLLILGMVLCTFGAAIYFSEMQTLDQSLRSAFMTTLDQVAPSYDPTHGQMSDTRVDALVILQTPQGQFTQISSALPPQDLPALRLGISQVRDWGQNVLWGTSQFSSPFTIADGQTLQFTGTGAPVYPDLGARLLPYAVQRIAITNQQNQVLGYLYIGISSDIPEQLHQLLITLAVTTPLILLLSSVGGYWLASRAIHPVQTITRTAQDISATDLHRRLHLPQRDELGELASTFDRMLDRLEGAFVRQRQFTADASHELRTPLSIVQTEADRVLQRPHTAEEYVQALSVISQENQRMTRLVGDLLILARADQGQSVLQREPVDLSEIIIEATEALSPLAEYGGMVIHLSGLDELVVCGDRLYLTHLCTNLLENAIKYSAGVGNQVKVHLDRESGHARMQISDEGPGIAAEHLPHLFERFYRADPSRTHARPTEQRSTPSGSGLGLSIARWIVEEHGGAIQVRSTLGKGTSVEVCLPCNTRADTTAATSLVIGMR